MAQIEGIVGGMVPRHIHGNDMSLITKPVRVYTNEQVPCIACEGVTTIRNKKTLASIQRDKFLCHGCRMMFVQEHWIKSQPTYDLDQTQRKMAMVEVGSWVMLKANNSFSCDKTGRTMTAQVGDVFKVIRVGTDKAGDCTYSSSIKVFTIDVAFGSSVLTLFMHEFVVISWISIMQAEKEGELIYKYLEQSDENGVYEPKCQEVRDELATMLRLAF